MLKIAVCDDDSEHLRYTAALVQKQLASNIIETDLFTSARELIRSVEYDRYLPDIAVLDIKLGQENGIELAKQLNRLLPTCRVIFLTGYADYAPASYEARHVWFVLKSTAENYLGPALQRAIDASADIDSPVGLTAHRSGRSFFLPLGEILYIDRAARKTRIICKDAVYTVSDSPMTLIKGQSSPFFLRCHQGYWVNIRQIKGLERDEFILIDGSRIPISRTYREEARTYFFRRFQ